jgi:hypothetical protein
VTNCSTIGFSKKKFLYFVELFKFQTVTFSNKIHRQWTWCFRHELAADGDKGFPTRRLPYLAVTFPHHFPDPCTSMHEMTWSHQLREQRFASLKSSEILSVLLSTPSTVAFSCYTSSGTMHTTDTKFIKNGIADIWENLCSYPHHH